MKDLISALLKSTSVEIYGFYSRKSPDLILSGPNPDLTRHVIDFGQSYASKSLDKATEFYHSEIECVNAAATVARGLGAKGKWILSVGATPTAHAATQIKDGQMDLEGELEL